MVVQSERQCKNFSAVEQRRRAIGVGRHETSLGDWKTMGYEIVAKPFEATAKERGASRALDFEGS